MRLIDADALIALINKRLKNSVIIGWLCSIIGEVPTIEARPVVRGAARTLEEWHEDYGDVLWWKFPIEEPPYVGSPLDCNWSGYHTHWTPIEVPEPPNGGADMRGEEDEC